jgi:hypothetical protein
MPISNNANNDDNPASFSEEYCQLPEDIARIGTTLKGLSPPPLLRLDLTCRALGYSDRHATRCAKEWRSLYAPKISAGVPTAIASSSAELERPANGHDHQEIRE